MLLVRSADVHDLGSPITLDIECQMSTEKNKMNGAVRVNGSGREHLAATPLLTVVIPNYNYGRYLGRAIDSVIEQDYYPIELIVVDDGSSDDSIAVARARLESQTTLYGGRLLALERNRGKLAALNAAIDEINGHYLIILDSDDWLAPNYASRCIRELRLRKANNESVGFIYTDCNLVDASEVIIDRGRSTPFDRNLVGRLSFLPEPALTLTSAFKQAAPFDETIRVGTKHHKWCRIVANGWTGQYLAEPLFYYRMHSQNMSGIGRRVMVEAENGGQGERILSGYWQVTGS